MNYHRWFPYALTDGRPNIKSTIGFRDGFAFPQHRLGVSDKLQYTRL